jgi:hypothetical protein
VPRRHSRDPNDNTGWVEGFEIANGVLYGLFDITDEETAKKIEEGTIRDVSIGVGPVTREDGTKYPEVITHVALTLDPHVREQGDFAAMEAAGGGFCFSASDRKKENFITRLAYRVGLLNGKLGGGEQVEVKELNEKLDGLTVRLEAVEADKISLEAERDELKAEMEAAKTSLEEANGKVAEFEAADGDGERKKAEIEAFEAEAGKFADGLVKKLELEPAKRDTWYTAYIENKDFALEAASQLGVKFEGEVDGEPKERPKAKPSDEDPAVAGVLGQMGYEDVDGMLERHGGEE